MAGMYGGNQEAAEAIAELQAGISAEQAAIENERITIELYKIAVQYADQANQQREEEKGTAIWSMDRPLPCYKPLAFNS